MDMNDLEEKFEEGLGKLVDILGETAAKLDEFARAFEPDEDELAELNAGKTEEEIAMEESFAAEIAAPIVAVLDGVTDIIIDATAKITEITTENEQSEIPQFRRSDDKDADEAH